MNFKTSVAKRIPISTVMLTPTENNPIMIQHGMFKAWEFSKDSEGEIIGAIEVPLDIDISFAPIIMIGWDSNSRGACKWQLCWLYRSIGQSVMCSEPDGTCTQTTTGITLPNSLNFTQISISQASQSHVGLGFKLKRLQDSISGSVFLDGISFYYKSNRI
jgi:hypothetical protein